MSEMCFEPAHRLIDLLRRGELSALELLERHATRVERLNPALNAVIATDLDGARERARAADAASARGESWGPLHGLPMTIKDSLEVAGLATVCGSPALKDYRPKRHAAAVQRLVDAGAIVFGKTNVPLYAGDVQTFNKVFGTTRNPWDPGRTPGGSSGGAAAALAAGLTPLELGSDLAGSIRTPAHFCGVYGHKPSSGLVPTRGHVPGPPGTISEPDLSVVGPLARSAEDLELALRVVAGPLGPAARAWRVELPAPRPQQLRDYRVRAWLDDPACPVDAGVAAVHGALLEQLRAAGCSIVSGAPAGFALDELYELYFALLSALFAGGLPPKLYRRAQVAGALAGWLGRTRPNSMGGFLSRVTLSHRQYLRLHEARERLRLRLDAVFDDCDVLLMPVTRTTAPPHNQAREIYSRTITVNGRPEPYATQFNWIAPATVGGLPATSAPVGRAADGLPVGVQVVGAHLQDMTTLAFARHLASLTGGFAPPPQ